MTKRALVVTILLASVASTGVPARADEVRATTAELSEAEARFREGLELYGNGSINEARVKLVQAYAVLRRTNILWNLAVAEFYSSRHVDAARHMRAFVRAPDADPRAVKLARESFIPAIEKQTARLDVRAPRGATVSVDGELLGIAPLPDPVDVLPGKHAIVARGQRTGTTTVDVEVAAGQHAPADLGTDPPPTEATARPRPDRPLSPVPRNVTVMAAGGAAIVMAGIGVAFLAGASSNKSDAERLAARLGNDPSACFGVASPDCTRLHEANAAHDDDTRIGAGLLVGAGLVAAGAAVTYFVWPRRVGHASASIAPAPGGAAAALHVTF